MPSSVIRTMRFDPMQQVLEIAFRGVQGVYRYFDVPLEEWRRFRAAPFKGAYLNGFFKAKGYRYDRAAEPLRPMQNEQRNAHEHDDRQHESELLHWGEA